MGKTAFLFPGQGSQSVGMGKDIVEEYPVASKIFDIASEVLGFDIKKMIFEGDEQTLKATENTQPSVLTVSIAIFEALKKEGLKADVMAGLSLGEYTALVASGALDFSRAVSLVRKRGIFMEEAVPSGVGGMAAIIALDSDEVSEVCRAVKDIGIVEPANYNCPGQIVISGEVKALEKACTLAKEKGAKRAIILPVSGPFHSRMLKPAGERLANIINDISFSDLGIPVISNVTAEYIKDKDNIKDLLIRQVSSPVKWEQSIRRMIADGVDTFIEIGPGKALSGFVKKIDKAANVYNVENIEELKNIK
jgi:[acyl-carrier-protein] S-malonyltransferase